MGMVGILSPNDRVELVSGEVVEMSPTGSFHQSCVDSLNYLFMRAVGDDYIVSVQGPVRIGEFSEPQPDLAVVRSREDFYRSSHPTAKDAVLLVEVSDSTLSYDRNTKLPLYANADTVEVWVLDLSSRKIEVHSSPSGSGYSEVTVYGSGQEAASRAVPSISIPVERVFG